jgi:hypothetical protein
MVADSVWAETLLLCEQLNMKLESLLFPVSEEETLQRHKRTYLDLRAKLSTNDMTDVQGLQFFCLRLVLCAGWAHTGSHLGGF